MKIVEPSNIKVAETPLKPSAPVKVNDGYLLWFYLWANRIGITTFVFFEFVIGVSIFILIIFYGVEIFAIHNSVYINRAKNAVVFIHTHWVGFLFIPPLLFFRLIIVKLSNLREAKGYNFGENKDMYSGGNP